MKLNALILCTLATIFACKAKQKTTAATDAKIIELQTAGCRGYCPIYRLTFWESGKAEFEGIRFTAQTGLKTFQISPDEIHNLKKQTELADLWIYPDRFESTVMDAPSATLSTWKNGQAKSVMGTIDRPKKLLELEARMKALAEKYGFQVSRGVDPNEPQPESAAQIIVQLKDDVNAGNWLMQFTELRLRLVKRLPPANTWVVSYDQKQVDEKSLIDLFKGMEGVIGVQPNQKAKDRN